MFTWIVVLGGISAFWVSWGIGANDLANSFGTAYGAKTLSLRSIILIAAVCELGGAMLLGGEVSKSIASSIADFKPFQKEPYVYMYGMLTALVATGFWLWFATFKKLAVSTTHSIVGGVLGFALVRNQVTWYVSSEEFPYVKGMVPIFISWVISPTLAIIVAIILYALIRQFVLRHGGGEGSNRRIQIFLFAIVTFTVWINIFFILLKGMKERVKWEADKAAWVAAICASGVGAIAFFVIPYVLDYARKQEKELEEKELREREPVAEGEGEQQVTSASPSNAASGTHTQGSTAKKHDHHKPSQTITAGDCCEHCTHCNECRPEHAAPKVPHFAPVAAIHAMEDHEHYEAHHAAHVARSATASEASEESVVEIETFDHSVEFVFKILQVFSSICVAFAHGANDVANSIGAFAAIYGVYDTDQVSKETTVAWWMLLMGGLGIVVGLATYGTKILELLGEDLVKLTPSRGFSAELSTSLVVVFASAIGLPISTTHTITGAVIGIGIAENKKGAVDWIVVLRQMVGWVMTLVVAGFFSAALFSWGVYAPSIYPVVK